MPGRPCWRLSSRATWAHSGNCATSSSSRVPPCGLLQQPAGGARGRSGPVARRNRRGCGPVPASRMAPQATRTRGLAARRLWRWISRASNFFPVPGSPQISTGASVGAERRASSRISLMARLAAMTRSASTKAAAQPSPPAPAVAPASGAGPRFVCRSKALATADRSNSGVTGLARYWIGPCGGCAAPGSRAPRRPAGRPPAAVGSWPLGARIPRRGPPHPSPSPGTCTRSFASSDKPSSSLRASDTRMRSWPRQAAASCRTAASAVDDKDV